MGIHTLVWLHYIQSLAKIEYESSSCRLEFSIGYAHQ